MPNINYIPSASPCFLQRNCVVHATAPDAFSPVEFLRSLARLKI